MIVTWDRSVTAPTHPNVRFSMRATQNTRFLLCLPNAYSNAIIVADDGVIKRLRWTEGCTLMGVWWSGTREMRTTQVRHNAFNPSISNNLLDTALVFSDLNASTSLGQPFQYANLSKPAEVPSTSGGILWPDEANKCFYHFGGAFTNGTPIEPGMYTYDVLLNQWNKTESKAAGGSSTQRVAYGAGTHIEDLGLGFYFGGYVSSQTSLDWTGPAIATSDLVRFEYNTGILSNTSGPGDNVGRAEGQMVYLPVSDNGLLVYFGGVEDLQQNGTITPVSRSERGLCKDRAVTNVVTQANMSVCLHKNFVKGCRR